MPDPLRGWGGRRPRLGRRRTTAALRATGRPFWGRLRPKWKSPCRDTTDARCPVFEAPNEGPALAWFWRLQLLQGTTRARPADHWRFVPRLAIGPDARRRAQGRSPRRRPGRSQPSQRFRARASNASVATPRWPECPSVPRGAGQSALSMSTGRCLSVSRLCGRRTLRGLPDWSSRHRSRQPARGSSRNAAGL